MSSFFQVLDNGMRVVGESMEHMRSVSIGVWVGTGSVCEREGEHGASHFIEHMLFKGTQKRTAQQIAAEMDSIGGNINAFTSKECTCFYAKVLGEHLPKGMDILSDIVRYSTFDPVELEREKGVVCEEIMMNEDSPEDLAHDTLAQLFFNGNMLALPILGTKESVQAFTREGLLDYMRRHYMPNNVVISCAGNVEKGRMLDLVREYFAGDGKGETMQLDAGLRLGGNQFQAIEKDIEQIHICMGLPGFALDTPEQFPLMVLNNVLGGSMSSRLFQKIREERGLAYSVYTYPSTYKSAGSFGIYAGTGEAQAEQVTELILEELGNIRAHGITQAELVRGKEQFKGNYLLGQEGTANRMMSLGRSELLLNKQYDEEETLQRIENVRMEDVEKIIPIVLDEKHMSSVFVGRVEARKERLMELTRA